MEDTLYYAVAAAALLGIALVVYDIATTPKPSSEFSELYFVYEKQGLKGGRATFRSVGLSVDVNEVWMDFDGDRTQQKGEVLFKGDTFALQGGDWHISDLTGTEILFAAYPKEKRAGDLAFSFCIANHLGEKHIYTYTILLDDAFAESGRADIDNGMVATFGATIDILQEGTHKVTIKLDTGEEIYFWVNIIPP